MSDTAEKDDWLAEMVPAPLVEDVGAWRFDDVGLAVSPHPSHRPPPIDAWLAVGARLNAWVSRLQWAYADWYLWGEQAYGEMASQALDSITAKTRQNWVWVGSRFPRARRRETLPWSLYAEIAALEPAEQDRLLDEAEIHRWTRRDMQQAARRSRAIAAGLAEPPTVYVVEVMCESEGLARQLYDDLTAEGWTVTRRTR